MNKQQLAWFEKLARQIPPMLSAIQSGSYCAEISAGKRKLPDGRTVRLFLRAAVEGSGTAPLGSHASSTFPVKDIDIPDNMVTPKPRNRKRSKSR